MRQDGSAVRQQERTGQAEEPAGLLVCLVRQQPVMGQDMASSEEEQSEMIVVLPPLSARTPSSPLFLIPVLQSCCKSRALRASRPPLMTALCLFGKMTVSCRLSEILPTLPG